MINRKIEDKFVRTSGKYSAILKLLQLRYTINLKILKYGHTQLLFSPEPFNAEKSKELLINTLCYQDVMNSKDFGKTYGWMLKDYNEKKKDDKLFYCFVFFDYRKRNHRFFIVPSKIVAEYIKETHLIWLTGKVSRKDTVLRVFRIGFEGEHYKYPTPLASQYENRWGLLE